MENIEIIGSGVYLPKKKVNSKTLAKNLNLEEEYITKRTGINTRYYIENETIEEMAYFATKDLLKKTNYIKKIEMIIVATTTTNNLMPGISFLIQNKLGLEKCICMDILCGCSGYINAFDIARNYIAIGKVKNALIIGVDVLSEYLDKKNIGTSIILSDGAGATLIEKTDEQKIYESNIESNAKSQEMLICKTNEKIYMDGREVYKYAITKPIKNIEELLEISKENLENIKYIIPHQSNIKILNSIINKLEIKKEKMYINIQEKGNTFTASIPIAVDEMLQKNLLKRGDKIIFLGYGGGLNTGSILIEY